MRQRRRIGMSHGRRWIIGLLCAGAFVAPAVWARETKPPVGGDRIDEAMGRYNMYPALDKLGRGVSNTLMGWLEVPATMHGHYSPKDTGQTFFMGLAHGLFRGIVRTGVGLYETVTFFLPYPEEFRPILPTLPYFDTERRKELPLE
jgi:putative exosortase-associated protein (TIGR04073 family)